MATFDEISDAILLIFDTLKEDKSEEAQTLIKKIDTVEEDRILKQALRDAITYLEPIKPTVAKIVKEKTRGFVS